jgi:phosphoglycolate phosphatase
MKADLIPLRAVAFDLDGTLVDSAPDICLALNAALAQEGRPPVDYPQVRTWIGDGPDVLIERALQAQGHGASDLVLRKRMRAAFDQATLSAPLADGTVFPGIVDLVVALHRRLPLVAVTNKPTRLARAVLDAAGLLPYLSAVSGADTPALRKPSPTMLLSAARDLNLPPAQMWMVGDGPADLLAAEAAGCPQVLVGWGYGAHALPAHLTPRRVDTPQQLLDLLLQGHLNSHAL